MMDQGKNDEWGIGFPDLQLYRENDYVFPAHAYRPERVAANMRWSPYPSHELSNARHVLIQNVLLSGSRTQHRLNVRLGIPLEVSPVVYEHVNKSVPYHKLETDPTPASRVHLLEETQGIQKNELRYFNVKENKDSTCESSSYVKNKGSSLKLPEFIEIESDCDKLAKTSSCAKNKVPEITQIESDPDELVVEMNATKAKPRSRKFPKIIKCDYCPFGYEAPDNAEFFPGMEQHLTERVHYSASVFYARRSQTNADGLEFTELYKPMAVINHEAYLETVLVICPQCYLLFENIFQCACHYRYFHNTTDGMYALVPVRNVTKVTVEKILKNECSTSGRDFETAPKLATHRLKQRQNLFPAVDAEGNNLTVLILCPKRNCKKKFSNYESARSHVVQKHIQTEKRGKIKKTEKLCIKTYYGNKTRFEVIPETFKLPNPVHPIEHTSIEVKEQRDKDLLVSLKKFHDHFCGYSVNELQSILDKRFKFNETNLKFGVPRLKKTI